MPTTSDELQYSTMTRIAGASESAALDVELEAGFNRAATTTIERFSSAVTGAVTVGTTAVALRVGATNATNRRALLIQNLGPSPIFLGGATVTVATGLRIAVQGTAIISASETYTEYAIATTAGNDVRIREVYS
jgi:hypothetical protein